MNFPNRHPLNQTLRAVAAIADADLIAGLEIANIYGATHIFRDQLERTSRPATYIRHVIVLPSVPEIVVVPALRPEVGRARHADGYHPLGPRIHGPGSFRRRRQHLLPEARGGFRGISLESQRPLTVW
jgi:hypothetical protein